MVVGDGNLLTKIGFAPDGTLYLTYPAYGPEAGRGQGVVLQIDLSAGAPLSLATLGDIEPTCAEPAGG